MSDECDDGCTVPLGCNGSAGTRIIQYSTGRTARTKLKERGGQTLQHTARSCRRSSFGPQDDVREDLG